MEKIQHLLARPSVRKIGGAVVAAGLIAGAGAIVVSARSHERADSGASGQRSEQVARGLLDGQWSYLAGAHLQADGLRITRTGLAIVEQDGSGGQANPPVNEYGTRLDVAGSFAVEATVEDRHGAAEVQLYGEVPVVQDEFRVEPPSVRMEVTSDALEVSVWDGRAMQDLSAQRPIEQRSFPVDVAERAEIRMVRQDGKLDFSVDGKAVGSVAEHGIFNAGQLWFGMDAPAAGGHWLLSHLDVEAVDGGKVQEVDTSKPQNIPRDAQGLQTLASQKRRGFLIGAAMALGPAVADSKYANIAFGGNFGQLTVENLMKFQFRHPQPDLYTFQGADALVKLARVYGLKIHGHALVFGEANPRWVQELSTGTQAQKDHVRGVMIDDIRTTVQHFKGKVASWDVVNEPMADYDDTADGEGATLREHKWYEAMGEEYIALAFRTAHDADPSAELYINDYGLEADGPRWDAFLAMVTRLKQQGIPIHGVGFQAHVYEAGDKIDPSVLREHIRQLAAIGLKSRVSEMDVYSDDGTAVQAAQYASVLLACISEPKCVSFTTWGVSDKYNMWQDGCILRHGIDFPWTTGFQPTPAVTKMQQLLRK